MSTYELYYIIMSRLTPPLQNLGYNLYAQELGKVENFRESNYAL